MNHSVRDHINAKIEERYEYVLAFGKEHLKGTELVTFNNAIDHAMKRQYEEEVLEYIAVMERQLQELKDER